MERTLVWMFFYKGSKVVYIFSNLEFLVEMFSNLGTIVKQQKWLFLFQSQESSIE